MITFKLKGQKKVNANINKWIIRNSNAVKRGLTKSANNLNQLAMENLNKKIGHGYTGIAWGHSNQQPIEDSKFISQPASEGDGSTITLQYDSPHAAVVEFGGLSTQGVPASAYGHKVWPIGASQGGGVILAPTFRVQPGYHYLQNAMQSITFTKSPGTSMRSIINNECLKVKNSLK